LNYNTIDTITHKCFFDIQINDQTAGRIIVALFGQTVPYTVRNFVEICSGTANSKLDNQKMNYFNSRFTTIVPGYMAQAGDITLNNGQGGESIYGKSFADENFIL